MQKENAGLATDFGLDGKVTQRRVQVNDTDNKKATFR
jgi:hypothetical protein